eukprot:CAMPEP_0184313230 /NCGR_PEP_ID=MMETSP1049-20130417/60602_1 /TAXON_ID=77928 /ORGANISM="Proteomonas sulcata, Strain CCMP704" /LENGTH=110 /DNA_ID=CAMNT_0026630239 /DNA_START=106 /DNA_END=438 /DNA_ORIENTATION=-
MAENARLKQQLAAQAKAQEEVAKEEESPKMVRSISQESDEEETTESDPMTEKDRLLAKYEERRKELEALQKQEQDRQERLLQEHLARKLKMRQEKAAQGKRKNSVSEEDD